MIGRPWRARPARRARRWPRRAGRALAVLGVLFALWFAWGWMTIVSPRNDTLEKADAIVVLGSPYEDYRGDYGLRLGAEGMAPVVAISAVGGWSYWHPDKCTSTATTQVLCFQPNPATTQGEAQQIRAYATEYNWKKIIVVTSSYHLSRARLIIGRCFSGQLIMTSPPDSPHSPWSTAYQLLYQTGGYVKAETVARGC